MGWNKNSHCFYKIKLDENISKKYLNVSAKKLTNKKKISFFKQYIENPDKLDFLKSKIGKSSIQGEEIVGVELNNKSIRSLYLMDEVNINAGNISNSGDFSDCSFDILKKKIKLVE